MLTINNISHSIGNKQIFKNLGFSISFNSGLVLIGKNGSGKTTLLKIIATLLKPKKGFLSWNDNKIEEIKGDYRLDTLYLGDNNFFKPQLTIKENIEFWAKMFGEPILIPSAIEYFNLGQNINHKISELSAGWRQRSFLSQLLFRQATIWLLDEPSKDLDKDGKRLLFDLLSIKISQGGIIIFSSHDEMFFPLGSKLNLEDFTAK
jgi:heme exporter protein A